MSMVLTRGHTQWDSSGPESRSRLTGFPGRPALLLSILLLCATASAQNASLPAPVTDIEPTVVSIDEYYDPLESFNRRVFGFNDFIYRHALIPLSVGYQKLVPAPARRSLLAAFRNLREPLNALYHGAQGEFKPAGNNLMRFAVNSTVGLLGLFDPAAAWMEIPAEPSSLNETLMWHGAAQGPFIVLPVFGASDLRSGLARITESYFHPVSFVTESPDTSALIAFDGFQLYAPAASSYSDITRESEDPYLYLRNLYLQGVARDQEVLDERE